MVSPDFIDPYVIPGTDVLRDLVGSTSTPGLAAAEADLSFARALQLLDAPVPATNDWTARELGIAVHAETVRIHSFVDGNGRSTRLFANLVCFAAQGSSETL